MKGKYLPISLSTQKYKRSSAITGAIFEDINIGKIVANPAHHRNFAANEATDTYLSDSIQQIGLLHPIVVSSKAVHFEVIAGSRRSAACKSRPCRRRVSH
jgi:ParB-like chromosome segregation protein Spo0J